MFCLDREHYIPVNPETKVHSTVEHDIDWESGRNDLPKNNQVAITRRTGGQLRAEKQNTTKNCVYCTLIMRIMRRNFNNSIKKL